MSAYALRKPKTGGGSKKTGAGDESFGIDDGRMRVQPEMSNESLGVVGDRGDRGRPG
jgi:hypothetical protein